MKSEPCNEYDITVNIHASTELGELTDPNTNWRRPFRPNSSLLTLLLEMPSERHVTIDGADRGAAKSEGFDSRSSYLIMG